MLRLSRRRTSVLKHVHVVVAIMRIAHRALNRPRCAHPRHDYSVHFTRAQRGIQRCAIKSADARFHNHQVRKFVTDVGMKVQSRRSHLKRLDLMQPPEERRVLRMIDITLRKTDLNKNRQPALATSYREGAIRLLDYAAAKCMLCSV